MSTVQKLRSLGFDLSEAIPFEHAWRVRCSRCEAATINGIPTHERGCPNVPRDEEEEEETIYEEEEEEAW